MSSNFTMDEETSNSRFAAALEADSDRIGEQSWLRRWLLADAQIARGEKGEMSFYKYEGPSHLRKFFAYLRGFKFEDYFDETLVSKLADISIERDLRCAERLDVSIPDSWVRTIGRYNAQDYILQRFYPVPLRQQVETLLDFGAGHGRMSNLAFGAPNSKVKRYIAVDAIPATYLTQRAYFFGLGLDSADYIDEIATHGRFSFEEQAASHSVLHLPTWRLDLIPSQSVDMVCCVQVLKELPRRLIPHAIEHFARVLKPGGALYIRDHTQFHDPSHMPMDEILTTSGFSLEFRANIHDRKELHGLPRIWRRFDPSLYLKDDD
jgi:SAM-dependent methyltransferase